MLQAISASASCAGSFPNAQPRNRLCWLYQKTDGVDETGVLMSAFEEIPAPLLVEPPVYFRSTSNSKLTAPFKGDRYIAPLNVRNSATSKEL